MSLPYQIFTYGSLQFEEVMETVAGARFPAQPARLHDYARYRIAGKPYPGLRHEPGAVTPGVLYSGVDPRALARLDAFEDDFYRRETLPVLPASGPPIAAEVYVVPPEHHALLLPALWHTEEFERTALHEFLAHCRRLSR